MDLADITELKAQGIEKSLFGHDFVYRFPESKNMPKLDPRELAESVRAIKDKKMAFYFHIPFCSKACNFCHYYKESRFSAKETEKYILALKKELLSYGQIIGTKIEVQSVFFGGGTPTMLSADSLNEILGFLREIFPFGKSVEVSVESSPETLTEGKLRKLKEGGFNRLSIGTQDFNEKVLAKCNRAHSNRQALDALEVARNAGFENINMDFIYGLPGQTVESWKKTMQKASTLELDSATASDLRIQKGTAFFSCRKELFPKIPEMTEMYYCFVEKFLQQGYLQQFPYQFVKKGKEMNFLENQWSNGQFIGIGAGSCSFIAGWDYNNAMPLHDYFEKVEINGISASNGKKLSTEEAMKRFFGLGLKRSGLNRKKSGIEKKEFKKRFSMDVSEMFGEKIELLKEKGLLEENKNYIRLSESGLFFHDEIARALFGTKQEN